MAEVDKALVQQFSDNFNILAQQTKSRLESTVTVKTGIVGTSYRDDSVGGSEAEDITTRGGDITGGDLPQQGRYVDMIDTDWWKWVYEFDEQKMLADPKSPYLRMGVAALNRKKDARIIYALQNSARQVKEDGTSELIALPTAEKIVVAGAGLTKAKLISTLEILGIAEATGEDEGEDQVTFVLTQKQISDLLGDTTLTSAEYVSVQMLMSGKPGNFLGFNFVRTQLLPKVATTRYCYAYAKSGVLLGIGKDVNTTISIRTDKRGHPWQPYSRMTTGAVRREDVKVVEIACAE